MPITINKVLYGITKKLASNFPDDDIYVDEVPQDLNPPAFFVAMIDSAQTQALDIRYWRYHSFDIHYFADGYKNEDMQDMVEQLYELMRWIEIDGRPYRGINLRHEIVDRVLHFFVEFNILVRHVEDEAPDMQTLEVEEVIENAGA